MDTFRKLQRRLRDAVFNPDGRASPNALANVLDDTLGALADHLPLDVHAATGGDLDALAHRHGVQPREQGETDATLHARIVATLAARESEDMAKGVEQALSQALADRVFAPIVEAQARRTTVYYHDGVAREVTATRDAEPERYAREQAGQEAERLRASLDKMTAERDLWLGRAGELHKDRDALHERVAVADRLAAAAEKRTADHRAEISRLTDKVQRLREDVRRLQALVPPIRITREPSPGVRLRAEFSDGSTCEERESVNREGLAVEIAWHTVPPYPAETLASEWAHQQRAALERARGRLVAQAGEDPDHE